MTPYPPEKLQEAIEDASHRHDTLLMQMTKMLEYERQPFWRKLFSRKALPPPADGNVVDMEPSQNNRKVE